MSHWSQPSEQPSDRYELRELARETAPSGALSRRWYGVAFALGLVLVAVLGFSTDLFDSGPTDLDVSTAYRDGFEQGRSSAEAAWQDQLEEIWWEHYARGQAEGSSLAPAIAEAVRDGFSWEGGFEAGLRSPDIDVERSFLDGWSAGFVRGWAQVAGVYANGLPDPNFANRRFGDEQVQNAEAGGDP
ncbi:MAG: hypothetical protein F4Y04_05105 [Chloroflexi bacterium]|nr:hypothetical protein [Chloroflexota bacterium]